MRVQSRERDEWSRRRPVHSRCIAESRGSGAYFTVELAKSRWRAAVTGADGAECLEEEGGGESARGKREAGAQEKRERKQKQSPEAKRKRQLVSPSPSLSLQEIFIRRKRNEE